MDTQDTRVPEIDALFCDHIKKIIIEWNEQKTLRSLLLDCQNIGKNFGHSLETVKTTKIKEIIIDKFRDDIRLI